MLEYIFIQHCLLTAVERKPQANPLIIIFKCTYSVERIYILLNLVYCIDIISIYCIYYMEMHTHNSSRKYLPQVIAKTPSSLQKFRRTRTLDSPIRHDYFSI